MARNLATIIENNLSRGLITEATGLNFPDNAATDALNVKFDRKGSVIRRKGIDLEGSAETQAYDTSDGVIQEFLWQSVSNVGGIVFLVLQIGTQIHFYELTQSETLSTSLAPVSVDLTQYLVPNASRPHMVPCTFASGAGYLFIAHPMAYPVLVEYDSDNEDFSVDYLRIEIRDTWGVDDGLDPETNPENLTDEHLYNLKNQGWYREVRVGANSEENEQNYQGGGFIPVS